MTAENSFGKLIKRRRSALGMSQAALADLVGRSASAIRTWERGASTPTDEGVVRSLAAVLGIDESELRMTVGMPAEIRSEEAEEIGGRGLVEFSEERFPMDASPATSAVRDRPGKAVSAEEVGAATSTQAPGESDESVDGADEISWDDVAASVLRHPEPAPPGQATGADRSEVDEAEQVALTEDLDEVQDQLPSDATVTEEAGPVDAAAASESVSHAEVVELDRAVGEPEPVVEDDGLGAGAGESDAPADQAEPDAAAGDSDAAGEEEPEHVAPDPDAPEADAEFDAAPEPETVSVETADRSEPPAPEPLAPAATMATRTTVMPVRESVAPSAAGSYLDDPDQMITYWIRAALTVALVMFLLVVLFWSLGKLGDSIGEVWALFKAGS